MSDIEKPLLMVQASEPDRDVLRFLWIDDPNSDSPKIVVKTFNRVVFGVTSSSFPLRWLPIVSQMLLTSCFACIIRNKVLRTEG